jgi:hypothetical protein
MSRSRLLIAAFAGLLSAYACSLNPGPDLPGAESGSGGSLGAGATSAAGGSAPAAGTGGNGGGVISSGGSAGREPSMDLDAGMAGNDASMAEGGDAGEDGSGGAP